MDDIASNLQFWMPPSYRPQLIAPPYIYTLDQVIMQSPPTLTQTQPPALASGMLAERGFKSTGTIGLAHRGHEKTFGLACWRMRCVELSLVPTRAR